MSTREIRPRWRPSNTQRRLVTVAALACLAALIAGRPTLVLLAAPLVGALLASWLRPAPRHLRVDWDAGPARALEGDPITITSTVDAPVGRVTGTSALAGMPHEVRPGGDTDAALWTVLPRRWGRWPIGPLHLDVTDQTGLLHTDLELPLPEVIVYPATPRLDLLPAGDRLARQIGEHVAAAVGHGGEFATVRPLQPGDPARHINWAVSSRRQALHVNARFAERALDVVVAVDTFSDVGPPGARTLDVAVRGAAATVAGYLRHHDRVGVVVLGGMLRWVGPDSADRQFYRIMESILDMPRWESVVDPEIDRIPRQALPAGALVVMFSPLLDERAVRAITDLRQRGFPVIVCDVLTCEPPQRRPRNGDGADLALRLWRLDRIALRHELAGLGVPVVRWDGTDSLDLALGPLRRAPLLGVSR